MATQTPSLPRIDFSSENSEPGTSSWLSTSKQVKDALENHGFFLVTYDKISSEVKNAFILAMKEFHDLPEEQKSRFTSDKPYLGYFGQARDGKPPILELAAIGDPTSIQAVEGFTNLFRSSGKKDHLREIILSYTKQVAELHELILKMVLEGYGVEKYYESLKESLAYICRVNKYRATEPNERDVAVVPHTDSSFMTILDQNEVNGLEVKSKDGSWVPVDFPPSSFALVAGDGLLAWSNGRIRPKVHRVIMPAEEPRYSIGLFCYTHGIVEAPKELVDEQHPLLFKPFNHFELVSLTHTKKLYLIEDRLKVLYGV
ncbi:deoxypodophyllotoxin synthase isoform X1 [Coffea arabica]|uniref:Deoxypodophyllotoxin synthase isoform X1 n=1 Tax=Coffea arabica TaxID=13443 RepID=A0A6P6WZV6_COFAR|nr:probable 2-oxoglutarate-dependent dioxygenase AOP1 isoform X1 [Coffea arabica]